MVQHLTHVRDYLAAIANQLEANGEVADLDALSASRVDWEELNERIRRRFISESQRELFDLILGAEDAIELAARADRDFVSQGSIELF
jgi:hypothetical protein